MKRVKFVIMAGLLVCVCGIANAAMVHQYTFNTDNQAEDLVGTADLTLNGTASVSGGALVLPGGGTRVNNASATGAALTELASTINGTDALTIEIWFTQSETHDWSKLFMAGSGAETNYMDITPRRGNDGNVSSCSCRNGTEVNVKTPGDPISNNQPYYMACVWDETNEQLSIYRAQAGNMASAVTATTSWTGGDLAALVFNEFYLGSAVYFGDGDYVGQIDEFRIYDTALSASEMEASLTAGPTVVPEPATLAILGLGTLLIGRRKRIA